MTKKKRKSTKKRPKSRLKKAVEGALLRTSRAQRLRERYANDPEYRARKLAQNAAWKAKNPQKQREYDAKWQQAHGAEAQRRSRQRKKESQSDG